GQHAAFALCFLILFHVRALKLASGVTVNDQVIKVFNDRKVSDDRRQIIVEEANQILVGDTGDIVEDPYAPFCTFKKMIYASSIDATKKKLEDRLTLGKKLRGNVVVSLEGKPCKIKVKCHLDLEELPFLQLSQLE
ncbi:hypothetical protein E2I00_014515, partial [Balaenoptera physalus]